MIAKQLGDRIKELRKETGLSQEKFALKIDMDRTYFATVELESEIFHCKILKKLRMD